MQNSEALNNLSDCHPHAVQTRCLAETGHGESVLGKLQERVNAFIFKLRGISGETKDQHQLLVERRAEAEEQVTERCSFLLSLSQISFDRGSLR